MSKIELFISHTSFDKELVESFVNCIAKCFKSSEDKIRCSSVEKFKYAFGTKLLSEIRTDIQNSIVIVFVTKNTKLSEWVLLELGIAMTIAKRTIVTVIDNFAKEDLPSFLREDSLHVDISNNEQIHQLIYELQVQTSWAIMPPSAVKQEIDIFLSVLQNKTTKYPIQRLLKRKEIFEEKNNLKWAQISNNIK